MDLKIWVASSNIQTWNNFSCLAYWAMTVNIFCCYFVWQLILRDNNAFQEIENFATKKSKIARLIFHVICHFETHTN